MDDVRPSSSDFFSSPPGPELLSQVDFERLPRHVAVIMDGNGRWATLRGLPRIAGHRQGASAVRELIAAAIEVGVRTLTIFSFSSENWTRPRDEVRALMALFVEVLERELVHLERRDVRVRIAGSLEGLPDATAVAFSRTVERTANNQGLTLVVALNYGGRGEIIEAVRSIAREVSHGKLSPEDISQERFASHLYNPDIPDPDFVIRTSGEMRVSNFLLWQIAYAELYVTDVLWPEFDRTDLLRAIIAYQSRARRFGGR